MRKLVVVLLIIGLVAAGLVFLLRTRGPTVPTKILVGVPAPQTG